jgi:hypothetical protein
MEQIMETGLGIVPIGIISQLEVINGVLKPNTSLEMLEKY